MEKDTTAWLAKQTKEKELKRQLRIRAVLDKMVAEHRAEQKMLEKK